LISKYNTTDLIKYIEEYKAQNDVIVDKTAFMELADACNKALTEIDKIILNYYTK